MKGEDDEGETTAVQSVAVMAMHRRRGLTELALFVYCSKREYAWSVACAWLDPDGALETRTTQPPPRPIIMTKYLLRLLILSYSWEEDIWKSGN
mmetsp:Transcript_9312/g.20822  ORF Transcript_9312/g.20822 Transcript_9312/m.20822 type:complete len:94 (+) Transcript_9312:813-1094(+)